MAPTLTFVLSNEAVVRIYDAVLCLAKFGEVVSLEARRDRVNAFCYICGFFIHGCIAYTDCTELVEVSLRIVPSGEGHFLRELQLQYQTIQRRC